MTTNDPVTTTEPSTANLLEELQLLECYLSSMSLDIPMLNAAKSEREWDWFFHKLEEGFDVAEVNQDRLKLKLAKRFMRGKQLSVWCELTKAVADQPCQYDVIRDKMYEIFFPESDYYNSLMELFGGFREGGNESPRRKMSLVGVKLVIGTAKETMQRVSKRYNREMPPESFWYQFALRLMTPAVKELFDSKLQELAPPAKKTDEPDANAEGTTGAEDQQQQQTKQTNENASAPGGETASNTQAATTYPDIHIEHMLNSIKDPNPRSMRAPHKFRRTVRKNRAHGGAAKKLAPSNQQAANNSPSSKTAQQPSYPTAPVTTAEN